MNRTTTTEVLFKQRDMLRDAEQRRSAATIRRPERQPRITWALGLRIPAGR